MKHRDDDRRAEFDAGLARLEELTKQFQRELGALRQVAADPAEDEAREDAG